MTLPHDALVEVIDALAALPGISIDGRERADDRWTVHCLMDNSATGEQSLSIVAFTVDCYVDKAELRIGGQHDNHPGRGCFSLRGPNAETAHDTAHWINFGRETLRQREAHN